MTEKRRDNNKPDQRNLARYERITGDVLDSRLLKIIKAYERRKPIKLKEIGMADHEELREARFQIFDATLMAALDDATSADLPDGTNDRSSVPDHYIYMLIVFHGLNGLERYLGKIGIKKLLQKTHENWGERHFSLQTLLEEATKRLRK